MKEENEEGEIVVTNHSPSLRHPLKDDTDEHKNSFHPGRNEYDHNKSQLGDKERVFSNRDKERHSYSSSSQRDSPHSSKDREYSSYRYSISYCCGGLLK